VRCGDDAVFLDEAADGYLCLPGQGALVASPTRLRPCAADVRDRLTQAGLLRREGEPARRPDPRPPPPRPLRSAVPEIMPRPRLQDAADAVRALADAAARYRARRFAAVLDCARAGRGGRAASRLDAPMLATVARFHAWIPYAPVPGKCLLRSFMLLRLLQRKGFQADWVFGVRTWPFAAHCWLQAGDTVLDDFAERLDLFEPILVV
jgi:hypothetical protein